MIQHAHKKKLYSTSFGTQNMEYIPIYKIYFQVNAQRFVGD